ncbi:unnamed protein product, partial [Owenia fusiformis]
VVFLLADLQSVVRFLKEIKNNAKSGIFTFVMSESTNTNDKLKSEELGNIALGSLSFKMETEPNKEFRKKFLEKTPWNIKTNRKWFKEWWQSKFNCHFPDSFDKSGAQLCDPTEHMRGTKENNWVHYVIQATQALAIGINSALKSYCTVEPTKLCDEFVDHPKEVIEKIKKVKSLCIIIQTMQALHKRKALEKLSFPSIYSIEPKEGSKYKIDPALIYNS